MSPEIHPLFPTAIFKTSIRKLTQTEFEYLLSKELESQTLGNSVSFDRYLLNDPKLNDLKSLMLDAIKVYAKEVMSIYNEFYITNSWLNKTSNNEQHSIHNHTNSILSGCYYISVEDSQPYISFNRLTQPFLLNYVPTEFNRFNSVEWDLPLENNSLVIFPSECYHYVKPNKSVNERISIAFNTFVKGQIGQKNGSELILN